MLAFISRRSDECDGSGIAYVDRTEFANYRAVCCRAVASGCRRYPLHSGQRRPNENWRGYCHLQQGMLPGTKSQPF